MPSNELVTHHVVSMGVVPVLIVHTYEHEEQMDLVTMCQTHSYVRLDRDSDMEASHARPADPGVL